MKHREGIVGSLSPELVPHDRGFAIVFRGLYLKLPLSNTDMMRQETIDRNLAYNRKISMFNILIKLKVHHL